MEIIGREYKFHGTLVIGIKRRDIRRLRYVTRRRKRVFCLQYPKVISNLLVRTVKVVPLIDILINRLVEEIIEIFKVNVTGCRLVHLSENSIIYFLSCHDIRLLTGIREGPSPSRPVLIY